MSRQTSLEVYREITDNGLLSKKRLEVYKYIFNHGPCTGSQVQRALKNNSSVSESVRNRITELVYAGIVSEIGTVIDPITGRNVLQFDVTNRLPKDFVKPLSKSQIILELKSEIKSLKIRLRKYESV